MQWTQKCVIITKFENHKIYKRTCINKYRYIYIYGIDM